MKKYIVFLIAMMLVTSAFAWNSNPSFTPFETIWNAIDELYDVISNSSFSGEWPDEKVSDNLTIDNGALFSEPDEDPNDKIDHNVGIMTKEPVYDLHVKGSMGVGNIYGYTGWNNGTYIKLFGNRIRSYISGDQLLLLDSNLVSIGDGDSQIALNGPAFRISPDNKIGIGIATFADYVLHVGGDMNVNDVLYVNDDDDVVIGDADTVPSGYKLHVDGRIYSSTGLSTGGSVNADSVSTDTLYVDGEQIGGEETGVKYFEEHCISTDMFGYCNQWGGWRGYEVDDGCEEMWPGSHVARCTSIGLRDYVGDELLNEYDGWCDGAYGSSSDEYNCNSWEATSGAVYGGHVRIAMDNTYESLIRAGKYMCDLNNPFGAVEIGIWCEKD